jgi:hypothetical protein
MPSVLKIILKVAKVERECVHCRGKIAKGEAYVEVRPHERQAYHISCYSFRFGTEGSTAQAVGPDAGRVSVP